MSRSKHILNIACKVGEGVIRPIKFITADVIEVEDHILSNFELRIKCVESSDRHLGI